MPDSGNEIGGGMPTAYRPVVEKPRPVYGNLLDSSVQRGHEERRDSNDEKNTLVVGSKVQLKGEIGSCDTLIVRGQVEAKLSNRYIEVSESGRFVGEAFVDTARIAGYFEGTLVARRLLTVEAGGVVTGDIQYGRLMIEEGGCIGGNVGLIDTAASQNSA